MFNYNNENIGVVTSGSMSPSLNKAIGMAYVMINEAQVENKILIKVRNKYIDAKIVNLPFFIMSSKPNIQVCLVSDLFNNHIISNDTTVVVVDLLRATSVISTAFHFGIKEIIPVSTLEEAKKYLTNINTIVAAERNAEPIEGFEYGNSPFQYMNNDISGKTLVLTTTNGTKAINLAKNYNLITASFINSDAVCNYLNSVENDILILCSGWKGVFNLEDSIFSGFLVNKLISKRL